MSYGTIRTVVLEPDDAVGASLLYPAPGFVESRGALTGRVVLANGQPAPFVYVQSVPNAADGAVFGAGVFTDSWGQFLLKGLEPGFRHFWIRPLHQILAHWFIPPATAAGRRVREAVPGRPAPRRAGPRRMRGGHGGDAGSAPTAASTRTAATTVTGSGRDSGRFRRGASPSGNGPDPPSGNGVRDSGDGGRRRGRGSRQPAWTGIPVRVVTDAPAAVLSVPGELTVEGRQEPDLLRVRALDSAEVAPAAYAVHLEAPPEGLPEFLGLSFRLEAEPIRFRLVARAKAGEADCGRLSLGPRGGIRRGDGGALGENWFGDPGSDFRSAGRVLRAPGPDAELRLVDAH